jgi:hypothetical protein
MSSVPAMSRFETTFKAAIADNERRILISTLRSSPDLTLGELHKLSKGTLGKLFSEITLGQLISGEDAAPAGRKASVGRRGAGRPKGGGEAKAAASAPAGDAEVAAKPGKRGGKAKAVNTRTPEGRGAYDEALFKALEAAGAPTGAGALIGKVGGTSLQARAGLARLIEAGRITWTGKARGTKYSLA